MIRNQPIQRAIAAFVLTTFTSLSLYPLTAAAQAKDAVEKAGLLPKVKDEGFVQNTKRYIDKLAGNRSNGAKQTNDDRFASLLNDIHEDLKAVVPQTALPKDARQFAGSTKDSKAAIDSKPGKETRAIGPNMRIETEQTQLVLKPLPGTDIATRVKSIRTKGAEVKSLYANIDKSFKETEQHLKDAKLPQEILNRHNQAVIEYEGRKAEFDRLMAQLEKSTPGSADQQVALNELGSFMAKYPNAKPHQYTDPNRLPFRTPTGKVREPNLTKEQYQASLFPPKYEKVLLAGTIPDGLKLTQATLPQTPTSADTAETEDVKLTQAIMDQAVALNKDPVKIYNWVRNNIQFIPSYGSIQGADMTLMSKRGNAFDTASLLIALYRASGIPARYVYGTIEVPADKVMNWVGGVAKPSAAQSLLGQGGIPNVALVSGGVVKAIRMEHVWVEAYVDYTPSRGAVNKAPNTWVPMDASFKQYHFSPGMNLLKNKPLPNGEAIVNRIKEGGQVNETQGWVQNLNHENLKADILTYQDQLKTYIDTQKPNATIKDILGNANIIVDNGTVLKGSLPYKTLLIAKNFATIPNELRWKFKYSLYASNFDKSIESPTLEFSRNLSELAGRKITLSYVPATNADLELVKSYFPKLNSMGELDPKTMATSIPGYLLNLIAEIRVDGSVVARGGRFTMGSSLASSAYFYDPRKSGYELLGENAPLAGETYALGITVSENIGEILRKTQARINQTRGKISSGQVGGLSKEDTVGDPLYAGIMSYYGRLDKNSEAAKEASQAISYRMPSYGTYSLNAQPNYWFGMPRTVEFPGMSVDVDYLSASVVDRDNDVEKAARFFRAQGAQASAFEHLNPEELFTDRSGNGKGMSAVKALAVANAEGQKLVTLNSKNYNANLSLLNLSSDVMAEISNAVSAGNDVLVSQTEVMLGTWKGVGYIISDPATGAGAYKISGGANGGGTSADQDEKVLTTLDALFSLMEEFGTDIGKLLMKTLGYLFKIKDIYQLWTECDGMQALIAITLVAYYSFLVFPLIPALFVAWWAIALAIIITTIIMSIIVDAFVNACKGANLRLKRRNMYA